MGACDTDVMRAADLEPLFENAAGRLYRVPTSASLPP
jgi:hypothetical protein